MNINVVLCLFMAYMAVVAVVVEASKTTYKRHGMMHPNMHPTMRPNMRPNKRPHPTLPQKCPGNEAIFPEGAVLA